MKSTIHVLIVDDHEIVREGLEMLLSEEPDIHVVGQAANGLQAIELVKILVPDVIMMDLQMPVMDGIEATRQLRQLHPSSQVLILTTFSEDIQVRDAVKAGAIGYLLKNVSKADLLRAVRAAAKGEPTLHPVAQSALMRHTVSSANRMPHNDLTAREFDVLRLLARGRNNREIASNLQLSEGTVKVYVSAILDKLGVADRTQAALYAVKHRLD